MIYPLYYRRGSLRNGLYAEPTGTEVNGLTGFRSLGRIDLYFDGRYWSLPEKTVFGAYKKKARQVKVS